MGLLTRPVNTLADDQLEYDGLLMGAGTPYDILPGFDPLALPPVQTQDTDRDPGRDGAFSGPDSAGVALTALSFELWATTDAGWDSALAALRKAITVRSTDAPLWFKLPGLAPLGIPAKVNRRSIPVSNTWRRLAAGALEFRCTRPWLQGAAQTTNLTAGAGVTGGLRYPMFATGSTGGAGGVADYGVTGTAPYTAAIANGGNAPAYPTVIVAGPSTGFTLSIDGHAVTYSGPLNAGDTVTVDYATGQAQLSAAGATPVPRTALLTARDFTAIAPGTTSTIVFTATGGTATVTTADTWRG